MNAFEASLALANGNSQKIEKIKNKFNEVYFPEFKYYYAPHLELYDYFVVCNHKGWYDEPTLAYYVYDIDAAQRNVKNLQKSLLEYDKDFTSWLDKNFHKIIFNIQVNFNNIDPQGLPWLQSNISSVMVRKLFNRNNIKFPDIFFDMPFEPVPFVWDCFNNIEIWDRDHYYEYLNN